MAKDDYYVIVYKILAYLYDQLKKGKNIEESMIRSSGRMFSINDRYWEYIIINLYEERYISGILITKAYGGILIENLGDMMITPKGIDYLFENSMFEKAKKFLREAKEISPFTRQLRLSFL